VGEAIDRAAAVLPSAPTKGKGIALCSVTAGLVGAGFEVVGDSQHAVLLRERSVEASRNLLGKPTKTVGRDRELGFLESLLDECVSEPIARAALVIGAAGIGKSRIRYELGRRVAERDDDVTVWTARGDPMSAGSPHGLVARALRRCIDVHDGEPPVESRKRLAKFVARRFPRSERTRLESFLGELSRIPAVQPPDEQLAAAQRDPVLMGDQTRRAFEDLVLAVCRDGPLLLVVEDLHWGDLPSVGLIDSVLRVAKDQPFMVLALARPEVRDAFPSLWAQREVAELRIGALRRKASEQLVREVLGDGTSDEIVARIVERADGNAFYLEELIRTVAEGEEKLPETVLAMVQSRLEALPEPARRVLRAASVFGGVFWDGGVAALLGSEQEPEEVQEWLATLGERELVTPRTTSRFPAVVEYVFRHALVREAAFGMLTPEDAERGHRLAGRWLEENGEPDAFVLAQHFDRGADPENALSWFQTAAEEALAGLDFVAAARASERALEIATELGAESSMRGVLTLLRADASYWQGRHPEAMQHAERAAELLEPGGDPWLKATSLMVASAHRSGEPEIARKIGKRLLDEGYCDRPSTIALLSMCRIATVLVQVGDYEQADALFAHVDVWAPGIDEPSSQARWNASLAARALFKGYTWGYRVLSERAAAACEAAGDIRTHLIHRHNAGHSCLVLGELELAESRLRDVLARGERLGVRNLVASAKNNLGAALAGLGQFDEARRLLSESISELTAQTDRRMEGGARNHLAELLLASGDAGGAIAEAERAVKLLARVAPTRLHAEGTLALALLEAGDAQRALDIARRSNTELDAVGSIADGEGSVRLSLALALQATGDAPGARAVAASALARLRQQAQSIEDPGVRTAFLERVAAHRRLAEIARGGDV
jgi:tetratricopeptide (TPR) repeat protein